MCVKLSKIKNEVKWGKNVVKKYIFFHIFFYFFS